MAGLATRAVATPTFFASSQGLGSERRKVVFISDIHLSADADTSWISENIGPLADFLKALDGRRDVSELVILGDLFDDWMVPTDDPPGTFEQILDAAHNEPVVSALKRLCENQYIQVTYVTGNHDLLSFEPATKTLIQRTFPEMVICSEEPGLGAYSIDEVLWAEHGHRYSLFNAPDTWSHDKSHLPLGYLPQRLQEYFPLKPRIVVFGHSHKPLLWQRLGRASTLYANTGTWIDGKPMTWVEADIQERRSNRIYTLSLWYLGQASPSQSGTIVVAKN